MTLSLTLMMALGLLRMDDAAAPVGSTQNLSGQRGLVFPECRGDVPASRESGTGREPERNEMTEDDFLCRMKAYSPNRELKPEASLMEPSKVLLVPHLFRGVADGDPTNDTGLAIEVEFNDTYFPWQNRASATDLYFGGHTSKFGITPMYRVRILKARSSPVRVPSFMPKGTFFRDRLGERLQGEQWGEKDGSPKAIKITTLAVTVGHHSNGQDGCIFAGADGRGYPTEPEGACPDDPAPAPVRINHFDGSFSTNYLEVSYFFRRLKLAHRLPSSEPCRKETRERLGSDRYDKNCDNYDDRYDVNDALPGVWESLRRAKHSWLVGATYQWNPPFNTLGGALEKGVRDIYGLHRFRVSTTFEKYWGERGYSGPETKRLRSRLWERFKESGLKARAWAEVTSKSKDAADCRPASVPGSGPICAPRVSWGVDFTIGLLSKADGLGLYSRFMQAQDNYNLSFAQRKENRFQMGLSFSLSRARGQAFPVISTDRIDAEKALPPWEQYREEVKALLKGKRLRSSTEPAQPQP